MDREAGERSLEETRRSSVALPSTSSSHSKRGGHRQVLRPRLVQDAGQGVGRVLQLQVEIPMQEKES
jgi:hypothetical protein